LVVIESMKMETVIRSPRGGIISKIIHKKGVSLFFGDHDFYFHSFWVGMKAQSKILLLHRSLILPLLFPEISPTICV